jgi:hypothetical protein
MRPLFKTLRSRAVARLAQNLGRGQRPYRRRRIKDINAVPLPAN